MPISCAARLCKSVPSDLLPCSVIQPKAVQPATNTSSIFRSHLLPTNRLDVTVNNTRRCVPMVVLAFLVRWLRRIHINSATFLRAWQQFWLDTLSDAANDSVRVSAGFKPTSDLRNPISLTPYP